MKSMKATNLSKIALATSIGLAGMMALPTTASAEVSATLGAANIYLWRGQNLTPDGAQISGSIDYAHASGFYAGAWTSSEAGGQENDLYLGFGGAIKDFSYNISYWKYLYPEDCTSATPSSCDMGDNDASEYVLSLGYGPAKATAYIAAESGSRDNIYYTIDFTFNKFNLLYGWWDLELGTVAGSTNEYSHFTLTYAFNDNIKFGVSIADSDRPDTDTAVYVEEDPLFLVAYSKKFDLK